MTKTCPSCDVLAPPDARYCRHCGTQLQRVGASSGAGDGSVSPNAATVPLSSQNTTDEMVAHPSPPQQSAASHTSEVTHEEMNDLLRRGARAGELKDEKTNRASDGEHTPARDTQQSATLSANHAERLSDNGSTGSLSDDFDSEQTQITISVRPLTSRTLPPDDAVVASVVAARANRNPQFNSTPQQVTLSPTGTLQPDASTKIPPSQQQQQPSPPQRPAAVRRSPEARAFRVWLGLAALSIAVIGAVAAAAFWFGARSWRSSEPTPAIVSGGAAPVLNDPKGLANAKLAEADMLLASGNTSEAQARLREAAALDPANAEPQRRLARLLLANGERRAGLEALRAVTRLAPDDTEAWLSLASAQFAEELYEDALESYRGLGEASPAALARDTVQLNYADALRMSGRNAEARVIYRRLASSPDAEVASASRQQLAQPTPSPTGEIVDEAKAQALETARAGGARTPEASRTPEAAFATPTPQPPAATAAARPEPTAAAAAATTAPTKVSRASPSEHYQRGVGLWATNRGAAVAELRSAAERGNADASYYLGLSIAEGRDPRALKRAELVAALVHFGRARRSSRFRAQSITYEEQLGRELDKRRNER